MSWRRKVIRPLHGLQVKTLHEDEQLSALEKIHHVFPEVRGVIVEKVCIFSAALPSCIDPRTWEFHIFLILRVVLQVEVPSAEHSEIKVGDIITHVNDVPFSSAAEVCILVTLSLLLWTWRDCWRRRLVDGKWDVGMGKQLHSLACFTGYEKIGWDWKRFHFFYCCNLRRGNCRYVI